MWCNFIVLYEIIVYNIVVFKITGGENMGAEVLVQKEINRVLNLRKIVKHCCKIFMLMNLMVFYGLELAQ